MYKYSIARLSTTEVSMCAHNVLYILYMLQIKISRFTVCVLLYTIIHLYNVEHFCPPDHSMSVFLRGGCYGGCYGVAMSQGIIVYWTNSIIYAFCTNRAIIEISQVKTHIFVKQ